MEEKHNVTESMNIIRQEEPIYQDSDIPEKHTNEVLKNSSNDSLIEQIYNKINEVIGGTNKNQMFCMMSPGTTLNPSDYEFDTSGIKPATVSANESRLVNKMFDACHVTGSDNGRSLPTQFLSALNILSPKLNPELAAAKDALRAMLMTKITYEFETGPVEATLQQIFYKLYEEWVDEKKKWAEVQNNKKAEISSKYPDNSEEAKNQIEDEYLEWYQIEAESHLLAIEAKLGKILGLFSIDDMQIIEGILNSSVGSELYEAKTSVINAKQYNPDGGTTYPVTLTPSDWPKFLQSSFNSVDLLDTPDAILQKYRTLTNRRLVLTNQITRFQSLDKTSQLGQALEKLTDAKEKYDQTVNQLSADYVDGTCALVQTVAGFVNDDTNLDSFIYDMQCEKTNSDAQESGKNKITAETLKTLIQNSLNDQQAFVNAAQAVSDAGREAIEAKTSDLSDVLQNLLSQLDSINSQIKELEPTIAETIAMSKKPTELTAQSNDNSFMEVIIHSDASSTQNSGSMNSSSSASSSGVSFWFAGYSQSRSSSSSEFAEFASSDNTQIDIGFHVTKVDISRAWFNPGVFLLSKDMFNMAGKRISYNPSEHNSNISEKQILDEMNNCIFSCFPAAFVIAKDVTIRLTNESSMSSTVRSAMQEQVSKGGGVFCFRGSSSSSSSSQSHSSKVQNTSTGITIKFPGPQILGYYLEKTPADESKFLTSGQQKNDISISDFVTACKQMIDTVYKN